MNGRIYDPMLGRFLSADTFVQDAGDLQAYNRYSYVRNNPTSLNDPSGHFWSALVTIGFAAYDTYNYATGKTTGAEYAKNMALNGAALVADVATVGQGGGLAVRAANAGIRIAKAVDKANDVYETAQTVVSVGNAVVNGDTAEIGKAVVTAAVEKVVGGGKGKHDVDLNKNKIHVDADAGKKVDTKTAPTAEAQGTQKTSWNATDRREAWKEKGTDGKPPERDVVAKNKKTGEESVITEKKELHHEKPRREGGSNEDSNLTEVYPTEHAEIDKHRKVNYEVVEVLDERDPRKKKP